MPRTNLDAALERFRARRLHNPTSPQRRRPRTAPASTTGPENNYNNAGTDDDDDDFAKIERAFARIEKAKQERLRILAETRASAHVATPAAAPTTTDSSSTIYTAVNEAALLQRMRELEATLGSLRSTSEEDPLIALLEQRIRAIESKMNNAQTPPDDTPLRAKKRSRIGPRRDSSNEFEMAERYERAQAQKEAKTEVAQPQRQRQQQQQQQQWQQQQQEQDRIAQLQHEKRRIVPAVLRRKQQPGKPIGASPNKVKKNQAKAHVKQVASSITSAQAYLASQHDRIDQALAAAVSARENMLQNKQRKKREADLKEAQNALGGGTDHQGSAGGIPTLSAAAEEDNETDDEEVEAENKEARLREAALRARAAELMERKRLRGWVYDKVEAATAITIDEKEQERKEAIKGEVAALKESVETDKLLKSAERAEIEDERRQGQRDARARMSARARHLAEERFEREKRAQEEAVAKAVEEEIMRASAPSKMEEKVVVEDMMSSTKMEREEEEEEEEEEEKTRQRKNDTAAAKNTDMDSDGSSDAPRPPRRRQRRTANAASTVAAAAAATAAQEADLNTRSSGNRNSRAATTSKKKLVGFDVVEPSEAGTERGCVANASSSSGDSVLVGFDIVESVEGAGSKSLKGFDVVEPAESVITKKIAARPSGGQRRRPRPTARAKPSSTAATSGGKSLRGFDVVEPADKIGQGGVGSGGGGTAVAATVSTPAAAPALTLVDFDVVEEAEAPAWGHLQFLKYLWKKGAKQSRHLHGR